MKPVRQSQKIITIKDVARLAGVAPSTVSLALNGRRRVSPVTRAKVMEAAHTLNFIPNRLAKGLTVQKTGIVGFLLAAIINPYHATLAHYVERELRKNGYRLNLGISEGDRELEEYVVRDFIAQKVDGLLIHTADIINVNLSTLYELARRKIPTVLVGGGLEGFRLPGVDIDLEGGSHALTRYLVSRGYRRFLFLSGHHDAVTFKRRINGFQRAVMEAGIPLDIQEIIETTPDIEGGYTGVRECFRQGSPAHDAIVCVNDFMALGALKALTEMRVRVPEDIGITGFDDVFYASVAGVPLTTCRIPIEKLARKSVMVLHDYIENPFLAEQNEIQMERIPTELMVRQSTR